MIAFPIPTSDSVPPILVVLLALAATAGFVVLVLQAVRYFRRSDDRTDVFGPEVTRAKPDDPDDTDHADHADHEEKK